MERSSAADAYKSVGTLGDKTQVPLDGNVLMRGTTPQNSEGGHYISSANCETSFGNKANPIKTLHVSKTPVEIKNQSSTNQKIQTKSQYSYNYYPYGRHEMLPMTLPSQISSTISATVKPNTDGDPLNMTNPAIRNKGCELNLPKNRNVSSQSYNGSELNNFQFGTSNSKQISSQKNIVLPKPASPSSQSLISSHINGQTSMNHPLNANINVVACNNSSNTLNIDPSPITKSLSMTPGTSKISLPNGNLLTSRRPLLPPDPKSVQIQSQSRNILQQPNYVYRSSSANKITTSPFAQKAGNQSGKFSSNLKPTSKSILEATKKRNQFGFGGNHTVSSVPQPPNQNKLPKKRSAPKFMNSKLNTKYPTPTFPSKMKSSVILPSIPQHIPVNKAAYERKKQRAKDSRVRLNAAIEKLSLSINVAGIQSDRRMKMNKKFQASTTSVMEKCVKTSKDAKKWDRPSFIDTAATLIQLLNEQCEVLEKEVHLLEKNKPAPFNSIDDENMKKRRKTMPHIPNQLKTDSFKKIANHDTVLLSIASYLDPLSLCRSSCVSTYWAQIEQFKSDHIWLNLCNKRFSVEKVNLWFQSVQFSDRMRKIDLFQQMHTANIQPHCNIQGNVPLGEGKKKCVSAWASLIERSNGETLRSVRVIPTNKNESKLKASNNELDGEQLYPEFKSLPIVELRIHIQNTGDKHSVIVPDQTISVDTSTRRKGGEMNEIISDERFSKRYLNLDGCELDNSKIKKQGQSFCLKLFDSIVLVAQIHARGCSTVAKFRSLSNFTKILVSINGLTVPILIPFDNKEKLSECARYEEKNTKMG